MPNRKPVPAIGKLMATVAWPRWPNTMRIAKEWENGRQRELDERGHKNQRLWIMYERVGKMFLVDDIHSEKLKSKTKIKAKWPCTLNSITPHLLYENNFMDTFSDLKGKCYRRLGANYASCCSRSGIAIHIEADPNFGFRKSKLCSNVPQTLITFSVATLSHNIPKRFHSTNNTFYSCA